MLPPPDADLALRDGALPALATVLDPEAFVAALRPDVVTADVRKASIRYLRYKPRTSCLVAYRLEFGSRDPEPVNAYAKAHRLDAPEKLGKVTRSGAGRTVIADRGLVISLFPEDSELPAMRRLADADARPRLLRRLTPRQVDAGAGSIRTLRYKPERRYVAQLEAPDGTRAVLKVHSAERYGRAASSAVAFRSGDLVRVPRRLGRSKRHRTVALEWLPGRLLGDTLTGTTTDSAAASAVGAALAELHSQRRPTERLPIHDRDAEAAALTALGADLGFVWPALARPAAVLAARLAARLAEPPERCRPIHGDFYAAQVLLDGDGVAIFDLDRAAVGDPAVDIGTFVAHLERDALQGALSPARVAALRDALLEGYGRVASRPDPSRIQLHTAVGLFRLAPEPFRGREAAWPERTAALLARVATLAEVVTLAEVLTLSEAG